MIVRKNLLQETVAPASQNLLDFDMAVYSEVGHDKQQDYLYESDSVDSGSPGLMVNPHYHYESDSVDVFP